MSNEESLLKFFDDLDREMSWRKKEILFLISASNSEGSDSKTFIRSGIALTYAHWEGFVKNSSQRYLEHINKQQIFYKDLKTCFWVFAFNKFLHGLKSLKEFEQSVTFFNFLRGESSEVLSFNIDSAIKTNSNLTSSTFFLILESIGIDTAPYKTKEKLIDCELVKKRNSIAHGNNHEVFYFDFKNTAEEILKIMDQYKDDLVKEATNKSYKI